jgi:hypothetical protein
MSSTKNIHHDYLMEQGAATHRRRQYDDDAPSVIVDDERAWRMTHPVVPAEAATVTATVTTTTAPPVTQAHTQPAAPLAMPARTPAPTEAATARLPITLDERCITAWTRVSRLFAERGYLTASEIVQDGYISQAYATDFLHALADLGVVRPHPTRRSQSGNGRGAVRFETVWERAPMATTAPATAPATVEETPTPTRRRAA